MQPEIRNHRSQISWGKILLPIVLAGDPGGVELAAVTDWVLSLFRLPEEEPEGGSPHWCSGVIKCSQLQHFKFSVGGGSNCWQFLLAMSAFTIFTLVTVAAPVVAAAVSELAAIDTLAASSAAVGCCGETGGTVGSFPEAPCAIPAVWCRAW